MRARRRKAARAKREKKTVAEAASCWERGSWPVLLEKRRQALSGDYLRRRSWSQAAEVLEVLVCLGNRERFFKGG